MMPFASPPTRTHNATTPQITTSCSVTYVAPTTLHRRETRCSLGLQVSELDRLGHLFRVDGKCLLVFRGPTTNRFDALLCKRVDDCGLLQNDGDLAAQFVDDLVGHFSAREHAKYKRGVESVHRRANGRNIGRDGCRIGACDG